MFVPSLVLPEIDYFLRTERSAMRRFIAELFDPGIRYQFEQVHAVDIARAMQLDAKFRERKLGLVLLRHPFCADNSWRVRRWIWTGPIRAMA